MQFFDKHYFMRKSDASELEFVFYRSPAVGTLGAFLFTTRPIVGVIDNGRSSKSGLGICEGVRSFLNEHGVTNPHAHRTLQNSRYMQHARSELCSRANVAIFAPRIMRQGMAAVPPKADALAGNRLFRVVQHSVAKRC